MEGSISRVIHDNRGRKYVIAGGLFVAVALVVGLVWGIRRFHFNKAAHILRNPEQNPTYSVYISHHTPHETKNILKFACRLEKYFPKLNVVLDVTRQVEINACGGYAQWIPQQMASASKIVVVLSKEYLNVVESVDCLGCEEDVESNKLLMEYHFIQNLLHEKFHVSDKLILVWENDAEKGDLPAVFKGRKIYYLPQCEKEFNDTNTFLKLFD